MSFDAASETDGRWQGFRIALATEMRPGNNDGWSASRILLASVEDGEDLDRLGDAVDEQVVWMNHRFSRAGNATGTVEIGMLGDPVRRVKDRRAQSARGIGISISNVGRDIAQRLTGLWPPVQWKISDAGRAQ